MNQEEKKEEKLLGLEVLNGVFRMRVSSKGNTKKEDFLITNVDTGNKSGAPYLITIERIKADNGTSEVQDGVVIEYSLEELKTDRGFTPNVGDELIVENVFSFAK